MSPLHLLSRTPKSLPIGELLPVMAYVYGGGFTSGSATEYNGTEVVKKNVVFVTMNYRLNAFGFFPLDQVYLAAS